MEPYRGFPQFMEAVEKLLKSRPNAHFVIAGNEAVFYGDPHPEGSYKDVMLKKLDIDLNRVHFVGSLIFEDYVSLMQISSAPALISFKAMFV
jgi:glycosyltransferase involved in cell wall biosynthesis